MADKKQTPSQSVDSLQLTIQELSSGDLNAFFAFSAKLNEQYRQHSLGESTERDPSDSQELVCSED